MLTSRSTPLSIPLRPQIEKNLPHKIFLRRQGINALLAAKGSEPAKIFYSFFDCSVDTARTIFAVHTYKYFMASKLSLLKIGILREEKNPPDSRVALTPIQAAEMTKIPGVDLLVQPSGGRCFADKAYTDLGVKLQEDLSDCDVLIGVKEVPIHYLISDKTYFFFSHTHKKQAYNRVLLQEVLTKAIRLIDYELLTNAEGQRLIAFGRFAGMVGAHHALRAWGMRTGHYDLSQMMEFKDYELARAAYAKTHFGQVKVLVTGTGRVGQGAVQVLLDAGFTELDNDTFLATEPTGPVFTKVASSAFVKRKSEYLGEDGVGYLKTEYHKHPARYESNFMRFAIASDVLIHGIFWDSEAPAMFSLAEMRQAKFRIQVIADVTCDIAPITSIPATVRASTIDKPYYGFNPWTGEEAWPFDPKSVTMCTIDNLPNEMPREASEKFGMMLLDKILPELLAPNSTILERATIARDGQLTPRYAYLESFVSAKV